MIRQRNLTERNTFFPPTLCFFFISSKLESYCGRIEQPLKLIISGAILHAFWFFDLREKKNEKYKVSRTMRFVHACATGGVSACCGCANVFLRRLVPLHVDVFLISTQTWLDMSRFIITECKRVKVTVQGSLPSKAPQFQHLRRKSCTLKTL
jgi:hypothetical protein